MAAAPPPHEDSPPLRLDDAEEELISSQQKQLAPETLARIDHVGSTFVDWVRSRRWGVTNLAALEKYIRYLSTELDYAPTTVSSTLSELLDFLARPPHSHRWTATELEPIYEYLNVKLKKHKKKQALVLSEENIIEFCNTAPNTKIYLRHKIVLIIGIFTLARGQELADLRWSDIKESDRYTGYEVTIHRRKTAASRATQHLLVPYSAFGIDFRALFTTFKDGTKQQDGPLWTTASGASVSRSTLAETTRHVAEFLRLPNSRSYTGHGLRAAGAMALANNGGTSVEIMMYGNWTSESAARCYLRESVAAMAKGAALINGESGILPQVVPPKPDPAPVPRTLTIPVSSTPVPPTIFNGCTFSSCTITLQSLPQQ